MTLDQDLDFLVTPIVTPISGFLFEQPVFNGEEIEQITSNN